MIEPMYKKGNRLAWTGFLLGILFAILEYLGNSTMSGASNPLFVPSLEAFVPLFALAHLICIALIVWGAVLALKSKNRSLWWLLLILPAFAGAGIIFVAIIFMLKDKSVVATPVSVTTNTQ
jgi:hypothetical protein